MKTFYRAPLLPVFICLSLSFANARHVKTDKHIHQFAFSYWNDNLLFENIFDDFFRKGKDDHVTASLFFEYLLGKKKNYFTFHFAYNILTNKNENYRADLLSFLFYKTKRMPFGKVKYGLGVVERGNFGGGDIQNKYHDLFGYPRVELPSLSTNKIGLSILSDFHYFFVNKPTYSLTGHVLFTYITAAGPSKLFPGLTFEKHSYFIFQLHVGYVNYYKSDRWLEPLFNRALVWKVSVLKEFQQSFGIGVWCTKGLYGIENEFHFGLHASFGLRSDIIMPDKELIFP